MRGVENLPLYSIAFSTDGSLLALGSGSAEQGTIDVYDPHTGTLLLPLVSQGQHISTLSFATDGLQLAAGSGDHTVTIWKLLPADQLLRLRTLKEQRERHMRELEARRKVCFILHGLIVDASRAGRD